MLKGQHGLFKVAAVPYTDADVAERGDSVVHKGIHRNPMNGPGVCKIQRFASVYRFNNIKLNLVTFDSPVNIFRTSDVVKSKVFVVDASNESVDRLIEPGH